MLQLQIKQKEFSSKDWKTIKKTSSSQSAAYTLKMLKLNSKFKFVPIQEPEKREVYQRKVAKIISEQTYFQFRAINTHLVHSSDDFWLSINKKSEPLYRLSEGDIIRVFNNYVKLSFFSGFQNSPQGNLSSISIQTLKNGGLNRKSKKKALKMTQRSSLDQEEFCRICLETSESEENPFTSPCECSGSMGYIHLSCLYDWVNSKFSIEQKEFYKSIKWQTIRCESCQATIPESFAFKAGIFSQFSRVLPQGRYVAFEALQPENSNKHKMMLIDCENIEKFYYKKNGEFNVNSSKDSHSFLLSESSLFISNYTKSKSCSVLVRKYLNIGIKHRCQITNGSTIFTLSVKKSLDFRRFFCSCIKS